VIFQTLLDLQSRFNDGLTPHKIVFQAGEMIATIGGDKPGRPVGGGVIALAVRKRVLYRRRTQLIRLLKNL
jgi:hypothetical protein